MRGIALLTILFCLLLPAGASAETPAAVFVRLASPEAVHDARLAEHEQARLHLEKTGIATASLVVTPEEAKAELIRVARTFLTRRSPRPLPRPKPFFSCFRTGSRPTP